MEFSAIIPYKPDYGIRDDLWSLVKKRYEQLMPEIELCIGLDESEPFNRSKAINNAARQATGDIFMIVDTDVIFSPDMLNRIRLGLHVHPWLIPFTNGYRLTQAASERLIGEGLPRDIKIKVADVLLNDTTPGVLVNVMRRRCFEAVSGFDETFDGWGYEDTAFLLAMDTINGRHYRMEGNVYHLWHPPASDVYYQRNRELTQAYFDTSGDVDRMKKLIQERQKAKEEQEQQKAKAEHLKEGDSFS